MSTSNDSLTFTFDPAWPWSGGGVGLGALILVGLVLVGLTIWTYYGVRGITLPRLLMLTALRLLALLIACLVVLRPSFSFQDDAHNASLLFLTADDSLSMQVQDQISNQSRWEYLNRLLQACEPELRDLRERHNITVLLSRFAGDVRDFDPAAKADGKRTDFGEMLNYLYERHSSERNLRGLLILSDGADNGTRFPALALASKWRVLGCPIHTFAFGQTTTTSNQRDIAFTSIKPDPSPVAIKGKLVVKGSVDAPGFENKLVNVTLLIDDQVVATKKQTLALTVGNEVELNCDAPATAGEVRVTLKIDPLPGELTHANNEISTYVTVTKEGISVLYVEGKYRSWEPKFIRYALSQEPTIRLFESVRLTDEPGADADLFQFDKQHYDVIILGDITARRLSAGNPQVLKAMYRQVFEKGAGLMMIGGYESFGNSDWADTDIAKLLPVKLDALGQLDTPVQMVPTRRGLQHYVMRLAENAADNERIWAKLRKLNGITKLGQPQAQAIVLAQTATEEPLLVGQMHFGLGRTLAFGGDTTWLWRSTPDGMRAHARFWQQVIFWLAKRDEADGNVLIMPDTRRLPAGGKLGFTVKLRGKGGVEIPQENAHFDVSVVGPDKVETKVPTAREQGDERGTFWKTEEPGEYQLVAHGSGKDADGKPLDNLAPAKARFVIYQDDAEMTRQAADHDFLAKLASAGGGKFHQADELRSFLKELTSMPLPQGKQKARLWPDWRRHPASNSAGDQFLALAGSGILLCFLFFVLVLCLEWLLRRVWGLV
ncbi:MAG TPA: glutamine amidotransferase [Gemmataceae bacterium]|nr:glutamine amidotransferase [Gemmataceae bacterium]